MAPEAFRSSGALQHPVWWVGLLTRKLFHLVVPVGSSYTLHSRLYQLATVLPYVTLLPFAFGGVWVLLRTHAPVKAVWLALASAVATCLIFFPQERYRTTEIDPTLIICTAAWVAAKASRNDGTPSRG